ncbi:MAG: Synechococcus phage, partial [Pseudomonadota bacterium]
NFNEEILEENFLYSYLNDGSKVEFRLINIIDNIDYSETSSLRVGDKIQLSSFGIDLNDRKEFDFWNYNLPTTHKIKLIVRERIYFYDKPYFIIGDNFDLFNPNDKDDIVISTSVKNYGVNNIGYYIDIENVGLNISKKTEVRKKIRKASSYLNYFPSITNLQTGVQNTYVDYNFDNFYVTSSGLPNVEISATDRKIKVTKTTNTNWIDKVGITSVLKCPNHNFYTGEKIYYLPSSNSGIKKSIYFLTNFDKDNIKLSYSNTDLYTENYIGFSTVGIADYFVKLNYENKTLKHQKIFKKFNLSKKEQFFDDPEKRKTINKKIGILADGVELFSTTIFQDNIYYGKLNSANVNAPGKGYDVINFSGISVEDNSGSGAILNGCITGSLEEVKLLSPGIGYQSKPKITLTGGNGYGAVLESNLVKTRIISNFKATSIYSDSINFLQNHNFDNSEEVFYNNNANTSISPLINSASYFVGVTSTTQIQLYNTKSDSISGINTISISGIGYSGVHCLKTLNSKNTITKIYVKNGGSGYSNRFVSIPSVLSADSKSNGVNTFDNYIFAKNHKFKNEDLVLYTTTDTIISGLSTQINYHITVVDENKFKLSVAGISTNISRENYINKKYVSFNSIGVGTHKFSYPPIEIGVEAISGITTTIIEPLLEPIVLGSFDNIFIENNGSNYGTPDIINFHRKPLISVTKQISPALLKPIISNGLIVDVQILNAGKGYSNDIDIVVTSETGKYAELFPIVVNGKITQILIIKSGINYDDTNTKVSIKNRGSGARFEGNVFEWKINQVEKNKSIINSKDEGIIIPSDNDDFGLQFINYYPSKKLRKNLNNFIKEDGKENPPSGSTNPYQILGWAYDGNPIFGPYGKINGEIKKINSSYIKLSYSEITNLKNQQLRPNFDSGFFIDDYYYNKIESNGDLDEYNGMFVDNKDFPNINYGYFFTINDEGNPQYPYLIGPKFKDTPVKENFEPSFNQEINLNKFDIVRNTGPYFLNSQYSSYSLIDKINSNYKQDFIVKQTQSSGISSIKIYNSGKDYKPGDNFIFDNSTSGGNGISAVISRVEGKDISNIQVEVSTFSDVTFITKGTRVKGITGVPHNLITGDEILVTSISSSPYNYIQGFKKVLVNLKETASNNEDWG